MIGCKMRAVKAYEAGWLSWAGYIQPDLRFRAPQSTHEWKHEKSSDFCELDYIAVFGRGHIASLQLRAAGRKAPRKKRWSKQCHVRTTQRTRNVGGKNAQTSHVPCRT